MTFGIMATEHCRQIQFGNEPPVSKAKPQLTLDLWLELPPSMGLGRQFPHRVLILNRVAENFGASVFFFLNQRYLGREILHKGISRTTPLLTKITVTNISTIPLRIDTLAVDNGNTKRQETGRGRVLY